jgi:hypothetical protein
MALPLNQAVQQLVAAFTNISVKASSVVRCQKGSSNPTWALRERAGGAGKAGQAISVVANHFQMDVKAKQVSGAVSQRG